MVNDTSRDRHARGCTNRAVARLTLQPITIMKSLLLCLSLAGVFALALVAAGVTLDFGDLLALAFAAALMSWFLVSYNRRPSYCAISGKVPVNKPQRKAA